MKKILYVIPNLGIGGIETFVYNTIKNINRSEFKFDILVMQDENESLYYVKPLKELGCDITWGGIIQNAEDKKRFLMIEKKMLLAVKYDVVHSHMDFMNIWVLKVAKESGVKTRISHVHTILEDRQKNTYRKKIKITMSKFLMSIYATHCLGCSEKANSEFYRKGKAEICVNGIDIDRFKENQHANHNSNLILHVGRMTDAKNPIFICEVVYELRKIDSNYKLIWVGDGELRDRIKDKVNELSLFDGIYFTGARTDIDEFYKECSWFLLPSIREGLPFSAIEAQVSGLQCFLSDVITKEVDMGRCLYYSLNYSPSDWAKCIHESIKHNKIGCLNYDEIDKYNIDNTIAFLTQIYSGSVKEF